MCKLKFRQIKKDWKKWKIRICGKWQHGQLYTNKSETEEKEKLSPSLYYHRPAQLVLKIVGVMTHKFKTSLYLAQLFIAQFLIS